jgi:tetratricopeptide (TPR) repeat protein
MCSRRNCVDDGADVPKSKGRDAATREPTTDQPASRFLVPKSQLSPARPFINSGTELYNQGKYQAAIAEFDKAVNADPKDGPAYVWRGLARARAGGFLEAIPDYDQALRLNARNIGALNSRGIAYHFGAGDFGRALADFNAVLAIDPSNVAAYAFRGLTYSEMGDPQQGLKDVNMAIKLAPKYAYSYGNLGAIYNKLHQHDKAVEAFSKQIEASSSGTPQAYSGRGFSYLNLDDRDSALTDFNKALTLNPTYGIALGYRGRIYVERGQYDLALKDLDEARRQFPNNVSPLIWRAKAYELSGNLQAARGDYKGILDLNPAHGLAIAGLDRIESKIAMADGTAKPNSGRSNVRIALVIGNSHYKGIDKLANPERDATLLYDAFRRLGFEQVQLVIDGSRAATVLALKSFAEAAANADWAVVYYAGHGIEFDGSNYLVPVDVKYDQDADIPNESVALDQVLNAVAGAAKFRLVILDACRENPFVPEMTKSDNSTIGRGLARIEPESGTLVAFATKHGQTATDGDGPDSPFALALVQRMETPGLEVNQLFRLVHDQVYTSTNKQQEPFTYGQLPAQQFYFKQ